MRANVCDSDVVDVELSTKRPINFKTVLGGGSTSMLVTDVGDDHNFWSTKKMKIRNLLRLGHFPSWRADNPLGSENHQKFQRTVWLWSVRVRDVR